MKPRGPLMVEHRLIERMLALAAEELVKMNSGVNIPFIFSLVDFIRTYADRTHHGKEEDILFRELERKDMSDTDRRMMQDLTEEHKTARKVVGELYEEAKNYDKDTISKNNIIDKISFLIDFYPKHIEKEDKAFFPNTEKYFTPEELDQMLNEFFNFDRKMIHEKYNILYESLKNSD
jgi:hemerythrin-like domain-containing protein